MIELSYFVLFFDQKIVASIRNLPISLYHHKIITKSLQNRIEQEHPTYTFRVHKQEEEVSGEQDSDI